MRALFSIYLVLEHTEVLRIQFKLNQFNIDLRIVFCSINIDIVQ